MVQGPPVLPFEEECEKHLTLEIFASGMESEPLSSALQQPLVPVSGGRVVGCSPDISLAKAAQRPSVAVHSLSRSFLVSLSCGDSHDERVATFLFHVQRYCRKRNLYLPHIEQAPDHPVVKFGHLFTACLLKMHDLIPVALAVVEREGLPNNEQDSISTQLPPSLAEVCKLVHDAKMSLIKAHQESLCSYEEVCRDPIARCSFLVDYVRSPMLNVTSILHKHQIQVCHAHVHTYLLICAGYHEHSEQAPDSCICLLMSC